MTSTYDPLRSISELAPKILIGGENVLASSRNTSLMIILDKETVIYEVATPSNVDKPFQLHLKQDLGYDKHNVLGCLYRICLEIEERKAKRHKTLLYYDRDHKSGKDTHEEASCIYVVAVAWLLYRFGKTERFEYLLWQLRTKLGKDFMQHGPWPEHEEQLKVWEALVAVEDWEYAEDIIYRGWIADRIAGRKWMRFGVRRSVFEEDKSWCRCDVM